LSAEVVAALRESQLLRFSRERSQAAGETPPRPRLPVRMEGSPSHLLVDEAPVLVAPLVWRSDLRPPRPLMAPAPFPDLVEAVADGVSTLVRAARYGERDMVHDEPLDADEAAERVAPRVWLKRAGATGAWQIDPLASGALRLIEAEARRLLPDFVTERYTLGVAFRDVDRWFVQQPIRLELTPTGTTGYGHRPFDIDDVADGFRLWLQLALLGAVEELASVTGLLHPIQDAVIDEISYGDTALAQGSEEKDRLGQSSAESVLTAALDDIRWFDAGHMGGATGIAALRAHALSRGVTSGPTQVVIIDEPERHLHPRLARHAAGWLARVVSESASPVVAASHTTQFLALAGEVQIVLVQRIEDRVLATPMSSADADTLQHLSRALGLDHGELLMTVSCLLLVEGEHDKVALEGIFGSELRSAGILVLPVRGGNSAGLFDSEILWRLTTAPTLMMSDNLDPELVRLASEDPVECVRRTASAKTGEEQALHSALKAGLRVGKQLTFLGHPGKDLILALDEDVIRSVPAYSRYPGHAAAWAAYEHARQGAEGTARSSSRPSRGTTESRTV
jgi:hypothetical protein